MSGDIKGILLDSGDTLVRPLGGTWLPGHHFREVLAARGVRELDWGQLEAGIQEGLRYLTDNHRLSTEDEERAQFQVFYDILLKRMGLASPPHDLSWTLADVLVSVPNFEVFPDTHPALNALQEAGVELGILSNTWPSLDRKYRLLGLREYFRAFVLSCHVGCSKPDTRIFRAAIEALGLPPENILFVDDAPENVEAASKLGLAAVLMARYGRPASGTMPWVASLTELDRFL